MKSNTRLLHSIFAVTATAFFLCSCVGKKSESEKQEPARLAAPEKKQRTVIEPSLLPQRFQQAGYIINDEEANAMLDSEASDEFQLKVGADITTHEPITLRDAMKALVRNKKMGLSWASDVNQDLVVDIDVTAEDNFYEAIDNILRQVDYFHEIKGSTLVIKYRETKQYHVAMPFVKQEYNTAIGGNSFGSDVSINSKGNTFDIWENIQNNIDSLIATWGATITIPEKEVAAENGEDKEDEGETQNNQVSRRVSSTESSYTIDKPIGLITVHAPKSLQKRISDYLDTLERELYKQIIIEAKIIEVQLQDNSSLGINWNTLLSSLTFLSGGISGTKSYGKEIQENIENGVTRSNTFSDTNTRINTTSDIRNSALNSSDSTTSSSTSTDGNTTSGSDTNTDGRTRSSTSSNTNTISDALNLTTTAASTVATIITGGANNIAAGTMVLNAFSFDKFINALKEQGKTSVLSNPKISVMNGQPALITVGREVTFIDSIKSTTDDNNKTTFTVNTEQLLSGVGLALSAVIKKDNEIIMNLVPITSELLEPIEYVAVGEGKVGLPIVNKREMSTTVKVKDGSMLVVGGLISESEASDGDFIFGTENIPYLKYLFGYETKTKLKRELIILLRPRII
jgi:general secretion pathway protein D/MSHA biogenesis protein MshL